MNQRIIYPTDEGGVAVIVPADCELTIEEIAAKDVPAGKPYKIIDVTDVPSDRTFRALTKQKPSVTTCAVLLVLMNSILTMKPLPNKSLVKWKALKLLVRQSGTNTQ